MLNLTFDLVESHSFGAPSNQHFIRFQFQFSLTIGGVEKMHYDQEGAQISFIFQVASFLSKMLTVVVMYKRALFYSDKQTF